MIQITRIRIKDMSLELPNRKNLEELRALLASRFGTKSILFEYNDMEEQE